MRLCVQGLECTLQLEPQQTLLQKSAAAASVTMPL